MSACCGEPEYLSGLAEVRDAYQRVCEERDHLSSALRAVYTERARLVAFLAACYGFTRALDMDDDEYQIVYVSTPAGQMSWHIHVDDLDLFPDAPKDEYAEWDGHTTEVKYERLAGMTRRLSRAGGLAGERDRLAAELEAVHAALGWADHQRAGWRLRAGLPVSEELSRVTMIGARCDAAADITELAAGRDHLRALVAEILESLMADEACTDCLPAAWKDRAAQWRERAGIGDGQ
jgi:hypothetical protein